MAYNKRQAIERRYESDNVKPYNAGWYDRETVDNYIDNGANNSSVISNPEFTRRRETQREQASIERRRSRVLDVATGYINNVNSYLRSGNRNENTRSALVKQSNDISNYLKQYKDDLDDNTLKELDSAMAQAREYLKPAVTPQATAMPGTLEPDDNFIDRTAKMNNALAQNAALDEYRQYLKRQEQYSPQRAREILYADPTRTSEYDKAAQLSEFINGGGNLDGLTDKERDAVESSLNYWANNNVNKNYKQSPIDGDLNLTDYDWTPTYSDRLQATNEEIATAFDTAVTTRYTDAVRNLMNTDSQTTQKYVLDYLTDANSINASRYHDPSRLSSAATLEEKVTYGYLKDTKGEDAAKQYWRSLKSTLVNRIAQQDIQNTQETLQGVERSILPAEMWNTGDKIASGIGNLATQLSANLGTVAGAMVSPLEMVLPGAGGARQRTGEMMQYANAIKAQNTQEVAGDNPVARVLWEGTSSGIENVVEAAIAGKVADAFGYGTISSGAMQSANGTMMGESLKAQQAVRESIITQFVTLGMSSGATLGAIEEGKSEGYSDDEAAVRGLLSGAIEYITEKVGMDGVFAAVKEGKGALMALIKSGLAEGSEEVVGNALDRLTTAVMDAVTGKDVSESQKKVRRYIAQGMSEEEAMHKVILDNFGEDAEAFASAFFSAGMSAAGYGAMTGADIRDYVNQNIDNIIDADNNIVDQEALEGLIETGMSDEFSKSTQRKAEALQQKLENGEEITQKEVKSLYTENVKETRSDKFEDVYTEETETPAESLRTPSNLAELLERQQTTEGLKNLKNTLGSEGQKLFDNAINEAMQNRADRAQAYREVTNVYNAGAGVTNTYTATHLTADTTQALYKAGIADRETYAAKEATNRLVKNMGAGVATTPALTQAIEDGRVSRKTRNILDSLGKKLGARFEVYNSSAEYNGQYNPNDSTIRLYLDSTLLKSADTDTILRATAGHEITHRLQSLSSKHYESLVKTVADTMGSEFSNAVNKYKAKDSRLSNAQAQDEVIADFVGRKIFTDDAFVDRLVNNIATSDTTVAEKKSALQSLKDFFHKIASWIRGNKVTNVPIDRIREIENKIDSIIKAGVENLSSAETVNGLENLEADEDGYKYSVKVEDKELIDFLENQEHITTYKAMQIIDGKLYPPMAARTKGEDGKYHMVPNSTLGAWQQAVEDLSHAKFKKNGQAYYVLDKADGSTVEAAYNPYEHSSNLVLNDQFESAHRRTNLVVVEGEIPTSEMNGAYKADHAKDATGVMDWKSGVVANQLKGNPRQVYLSRYFKPVRILSDAEVAEMWADTLKGNDVKVPFNVVTPSLLTELEKAGIEIDYNGSPMYQSLQRRAAERTRNSVKDSTGNELTSAQQEYFKDSKVRDEDGNLLVVYHGTGRADRVGTVFRADRATSGPMAFFTDNKAIADNYARDKRDTSISYDSRYDNYYTQFRVTRDGKDISVPELWRTLSASEKNRVKETAKHITFDEDYENIIYDENAEHGLGNWDAYLLNSHKGNALEALVEAWLEDGNLYNEENRFLEVLEKVGITDAEYLDPEYRDEKTYENYLNITKPFDATEAVTPKFVEDYLKWYSAQDKSKYETAIGINADMWDKRNVSANQFAERMNNDIKNGTSFAWTSIPDSVTDYLKELGYDGIKDAGGKNGGEGHNVWIPFYSEQIKNIDNKNPTTNPDIRYSVKDTEYLNAVDNGDWETAQRMVKEAAAAIGYTVEGYHGTQQFGFTVPDTSHSDDRLSFFVTNDINTATTYSAVDGKRFVWEGGLSDEELEDREIETEETLDEAAWEFSETLNRFAGYYNWSDGNDIRQRLNEIAEKYKNDLESVDIEAWEFLEEYVHDAYASNDGDWDEYDEWADSDEAQELWGAANNALAACTEYSKALTADTTPGNYHVYINPTGILEVDGQGKQWNQIPFMPKEIQEVSDRINEIEKKYLSLSNLPQDAKRVAADDTEWRELRAKLNELLDKYHWYGKGTTGTTRSIAKFAADNGYTGVLFHNIIDDGGSGVKRAPVSDVYALFNPQAQVKSADPATYDDNGNLIPLSERFNENNQDIRYSTKDTGYHAGDLGKAESLFNQSGGRSTGHFGTGTYFVGNQTKIEGYNTRNGQPAPVETVDFSQYNLFKPNNYNDAYALHEFMKRVDDRYGSYEGAKSAREYEKLKDRLNDAFYEFDEDETNDAKIIDEVIDLADKTIGRYELVRVVQHHSNDNLWVGADSLYDENENELQPAEYLKRIPHDDAANIIGWIADEAGNWRSPGLDMAENYERWRGTFGNVANILGVSEETLENTIAEASAEVRDIQYPASTTADSIATRVMKKLGYEGVDVRHIDRMDNTTYGSVIYDLKGADLARKQEIGTARFSRKGSPEIDYDTAIELQKANKQLKEEVERLRTEFKRKPIDVKDFSSRITRTIRSYEGTVDAQEIIDSLLPDARKFVLNPNKANEDKLYGKIQDAAHKIITTALTRDEFSEAAQVREFLKGRRIKVSPKIQSDFGDWMRDYHRRYFGNLYFTKDKGTSVEETYSELQQMFGEGMFPSYHTNPSDQLEHILEVYEAVDSYYNPYDGQTAEAIESLSMELVADVLDTKVKYTYADKMHDRIARIRAEKNQKYEDLKAHYREVAENARNRRDERETRRRLLNVAQRLERIKTTAANRALIESLIGDLDTISMGMTGQGFENLQNLSRWYDSIMEDPDFVRDPNIEDKIKRLGKRHINGITRNIGTYATLAEAKLAQKNYDGDGTTNIRKTPDGYILTAHEDVMSIEDVRDLLDVLLNVENEIQTAKQLIDTEDRRDTFEMAQQIVEDIRQSAGVKDVTAMFDRYIVQGTLSPERAIHRYTGYVENDPLYLATKNLSSGQRNMLDYQYRANKKFLKFTEDGKFMDEITGKKAKALKYKMKNIQGNEVEVAITPAMRISLYLHSLNPQNLRHIVVGGLTVPTWNDYVKGKMETAYATGTVVRLTPSEIRSITSQMTTKEMALAREVYNYFNGMSQDAINAVSEKLKGYALARVSDYFPINTDNNFLHKDFGRLMENGTIQGMGFLQERNKNAVNPVRLRDVTDVLKQSIDMTSKYVGLAIPVSNINKLLNAQAGVWDKETETWKVETAVKKELSLKWKDKSIDYIEKLIGDLQNPINTQEDLDKVLSKVRSNYAGAVLTLNLSVAMKQAASYPTAAAVVGWKPLAKAMTQFGSVDLDLIARYTPLQWYRTQGYSTQELGDIKSRGKLMSNLPKALNWIQAVDLATTRKLWKAAEIYVQENNKALAVGTDEYYKTVAEIYNQIIEETQPNYTTMQRPEMLRSNSPMIQAISMFKTQPFQNFNITFDAVANYLAKRKADKNLNTEQSHTELKQAQKRLSWAVTSQVAQLFTFAAMTLLWNALRGKWKKYKDEEENLTVGSVSAGLAKDMASSLFSEVPLGAEAWEFISSKLFGDTYYGFDSVSVSALNDMVDAFDKAGKAIVDFKDGEKNINSTRLALDSAAKSITKVFGIPYENVENLFNLGFMNVSTRLAPAFGSDKYEGQLAYLKLTVDPNKYKSDYYDNLIAAYESGNKDSYQNVYDEMVNMDAFGEEKVQKKMDEYLKEKYNLKVKPSKYEGVEPETLQKISEALVKADANNADETKRNESFDQNEIYNALMSLALDKQTAEKVWANEYGGNTTWDEYVAKQQATAEAVDARNKALDKVGLTAEDFETYISSMDSVTQANAYAVLEDSNYTTSQRRTLWEYSKEKPWGTTYDEYVKSQQKKSQKKAEPKKEEPKEETKEEPKNEGYVSVGSSWISGLEYDNATGTLYVTTNSGRTYTHSCSYDTYQAFKNSDSPGSFYNSHFK